MGIVVIGCDYISRLRDRCQTVQGIVIIEGGIAVRVGHGSDVPLTVVLILRKGVIRVDRLVKLAGHSVSRILIDRSLPVGAIVCWIIIALFNHIALGVIIISDIVSFMIHAPCQSAVNRIIFEAADNPVLIGPGIRKTGCIVTNAGRTSIGLMGNDRNPSLAVIGKAFGLPVYIRHPTHLPGSVIIRIIGTSYHGPYDGEKVTCCCIVDKKSRISISGQRSVNGKYLSFTVMCEDGDILILDDNLRNIFCKPFFNNAEKHMGRALIGNGITVVVIIEDGLFVAAAKDTDLGPGQRHIHTRMIGIGYHPFFRAAEVKFDCTRVSPVIIVLVLVDRIAGSLYLDEVHLAIISPADHIAVNVGGTCRSLHGRYPLSAFYFADDIGPYRAVVIRDVHPCFTCILNANALALYAKVAHRPVLIII